MATLPQQECSYVAHDRSRSLCARTLHQHRAQPERSLCLCLAVCRETIWSLADTERLYRPELHVPEKYHGLAVLICPLVKLLWHHIQLPSAGKRTSKLDWLEHGSYLLIFNRAPVASPVVRACTLMSHCRSHFFRRAQNVTLRIGCSIGMPQITLLDL